MQWRTKLKIEQFRDLLRRGWSVRQALRFLHLGRSSYIKYYDLIFTPEFLKELESDMARSIAMSVPPYYYEVYGEADVLGLESSVEARVKRVLDGKPTPLSSEGRKRLIGLFKAKASRRR